MSARARERFEIVIRKAKPAYLILFFGLVGTGTVYWLETSETPAIDVLLVSLLVVVSALLLELWREIALMRQDLLAQTPFQLCWNEDDTLRILHKLDREAGEQSCVRAVWGALAVSDGFEDFVKKQLKQLEAKDYVVERWVDVSKVAEEPLLTHVREAALAMQKRRYVLHLVPAAPFGALVVDEEAAAINFQAHRNRPEVIGIYANDKTLARRVRTMIDELDKGLELPGDNSPSTPVEDLVQQAKEYYAANSSLALAA